MSMPSYQKRVMLLDEILTEGIRLFKRMLASEENLRKQLVNGDHRAIMESEQERKTLQVEINTLEEKRKALIPAGTGMQSFIKRKISRSKQPLLLDKLNELQVILKEIRTIHEVNQVLMAERLRFSKEIQEKVLNSQTAYYDQKGRLNKEEKPSKKIDRNC